MGLLTSTRKGPTELVDCWNVSRSHRPLPVSLGINVVMGRYYARNSQR
jgi:hypothetical protein